MSLPQLLGDAAVSTIDKEIDGFLLTAGANPTSAKVTDFLKLYPVEQRGAIAQALVARGVHADSIANALNWLNTEGWWSSNKTKVWGGLALVSAAASAFHGYRRNQSIGWALGWFVLGSIFPVVTPVLAVAQGFGKRKAA